MDKLRLLRFESKEKVRAHISSPQGFKSLGTLFEDLYNSSCFPSEEAMVNSKLASERTVMINTGTLSLTDFASPLLNFQRAKKGQSVNQFKIFEQKTKLIADARDVVRSLF